MTAQASIESMGSDTMETNFFSLIKDKRFGPLFWVQLFGAFHDNLFRSTLLMLVTFGVGVSEGVNTIQLTTAIGGATILPFLLFSSIAGQMADKYDKAYLVRVLKGCEIGIMLVALYGLATLSLPILLFTLFLTMVQSSFFGPIKYSLIPASLEKEKIINANALVEGSTNLAIMGGMIVAPLLLEFGFIGYIILSIILLSSACVGFYVSLKIPPNTPAAPALKLNWNLIEESISIVRYAASSRTVFLAIIGISWFWVIGIVMFTQIGAYGKIYLGGGMIVASFFLFLFALGNGLGSYLSSRIMGKEVDPRVIPWGALATTVFIIDLVITTHHVDISNTIGIFGFLMTFNGWHITFDLILIGLATGISMVPLYAIMQTQSDPDHCSRIVAGNNIMNSFFMVISSVASMILIHLGVTLLNIFLIVALLNLFVIHRLSVLVPESILQLILQAVLKLLYRVEVKGLENFHKAGDKVLIVANHISFLDAILIFAFIPERLSYAIYTFYIERWWVRIIKPGADLLPIDPTNPYAARKLIELIRSNKKCVIFPEGRITVTGSLMKVFDGPGMIADRSGALVLPIRIDGAQFSIFSRLRGKLKQQLFPKIVVNILPPRRFEVPEDLRGKRRRAAITSHLSDVMQEMTFETSPYKQTIIKSLFEAARQYGMTFKIVEDIQRQKMSYRTLIMRTFILGGWLKNQTLPKEQVGVMLPTSIASMLSFFSLLLIGRVPTMLNFSLGENILIHTCKLAQVRLVLTSRKFVELARLEATVESLKKQVTVYYLEDLKEELGIVDKLRGLISSYFPERASREYQKNITPQDPAVVLFTSGSEGFPKGVVLSHENLNANRFQITSVIDLTPQDVLLNVLPTFHSFGLTGGLLTPILTGIRTFLYPSPLHYRVIPIIAYEIDATIFFATDTFLSKYAITAHPYDFYSMRYVVAGAEKLREETRRTWLDKFGIQVHDAYGTTEASPAVSINTRMQNQIGTVGRFVPGMEHRLKPVEGIEDGGRLLLKGPNIMLGYIDPKTHDIIPPTASFADGEEEQRDWYDTGDIVSVDEQNYVTIKGRAKRFAKIAGEMVSLAAVEMRLQEIFPGSNYLVLATPDPRRGEQLVLLTTGDLTGAEIGEAFKNRGLSHLLVPKKLYKIDSIPVLPTGKTDFGGAKKIMEKLIADEA